MFRAIDFVNAPLMNIPLSEIVWRSDGISECAGRALMSAKKPKVGKIKVDRRSREIGARPSRAAGRISARRDGGSARWQERFPGRGGALRPEQAACAQLPGGLLCAVAALFAVAEQGLDLRCRRDGRVELQLRQLLEAVLVGFANLAFDAVGEFQGRFRIQPLVVDDLLPAGLDARFAIDEFADFLAGGDFLAP